MLFVVPSCNSISLYIYPVSIRQDRFVTVPYDVMWISSEWRRRSRVLRPKVYFRTFASIYVWNGNKRSFRSRSSSLSARMSYRWRFPPSLIRLSKSTLSITSSQGSNTFPEICVLVFSAPRKIDLHRQGVSPRRSVSWVGDPSLLGGENAATATNPKWKGRGKPCMVSLYIK